MLEDDLDDVEESMTFGVSGRALEQFRDIAYLFYVVEVRQGLRNAEDVEVDFADVFASALRVYGWLLKYHVEGFDFFGKKGDELMKLTLHNVRDREKHGE